MTRSRSRGRRGARLAVSAVALACALASGASRAQSAKSQQVTLTFLTYVANAPAYGPLIERFEHAYPNVRIEVTYTPTIATLYQLESTELAAGNASDILSTYPGCGTPISICKLAKAGFLAPMIGKRWVKSMDSRVLSLSKVGPTLFIFEPVVVFDGLLTNDTKLRALGLRIPQTFAQLLAFCKKARAAGTIPVLLPAQGSNTLQQLIADIALTTVYAKDKQWRKKLLAGTATFAGTPGWHQALQEIVDLNNAGCFQQGPAATTAPSGDAIFAQGQTLTYAMMTSHKGSIDAGKPQFTYSQSPFPTADDARKTVFELHLPLAMSVNAHSGAQKQATAQSFIDFLARPDEDALQARLLGGLSQAQLRGGRFPGYLSNFLPLYKQHRYGINPIESWWNASVGDALSSAGTGLLTGQSSVDDVLKAMDAAWKLGPD